MTFGQLAKRLSMWTSRGIVSAAILVAGLAFGRQVLEWWHADRQEPGTSAQPSFSLGSLGDPAQEHVLEFGDSQWRMARCFVAADNHHVLGEMEARCAEIIGTCPVPEGQPGPAETNFLKRVAKAKPAREAAGKWRLFALDSAFPMVIGTRASGAADGPPNDRIVKPHQRVVIWGLAVPAGGDGWTVYTFHTAPSKGEALSATAEPPIPPGGRMILAIRAADGGTITAIEGPDRPGQWKRLFDAWLSAHGWRAAEGWQHRGAAWSLRAVGEKGGSLDTVLTSDGAGAMTGVVLWTPFPAGVGHVSNVPAPVENLRPSAAR